MVPLISPEYRFDYFCAPMIGRDPSHVVDAASAEITYARTNHREKTKQQNFRKGSKGRIYCEYLQMLIGVYMGTVPESTTREFSDALRPLAVDLLCRCEITALRAFLNQERLGQIG